MANNSPDYEKLAYPNYVFADTHPSRLTAIGKFFGLNCACSEKCRVLEIGCGGGLNVLSHANSLPSAEFLAIDSSQRHINTAQELQKLSGISNIKFACQKLESIGNTRGTFDYIICHGVFSWVPVAVQHEILILCRNLLNESGIAFISFNTMPGWHIQQIIREALLFHTQNLSEPQELTKASKEFLNFTKNLFPKNAQSLLNPTIDHLLEVEENYLVHEHLSEVNNPLYFHQFQDLCKDHGLIYLADSDLGTMIPKEFEPKIQDKISDLAGGSLSKMEQYCDILRLRQFRKTLICKDSSIPKRHLDPERLLPLYVSVEKSTKKNEYRSKGTLENSELSILEKEFPRWIKVSDLVGAQSNPGLLLKILEEVMVGTLLLRDAPCPMLSNCTDPNQISPLVKSLIPFGNVVPNLRSDTVALSAELHQALKDKRTLSTENFAELCKLGLI